MVPIDDYCDRYFCDSCDVVCCDKCALLGAHKGHTIKSIDDAAAECKAALSVVSETALLKSQKLSAMSRQRNAVPSANTSQSMVSPNVS